MENVVRGAFVISDFTRAFLCVDKAFESSLQHLVSDKVNWHVSPDVLTMSEKINQFQNGLKALDSWRIQFTELGVDISPEDHENLYNYLQNLMDIFLKITKMYRTLWDETNAFITLPNEYIQKQMSVLYVNLTRMITVVSS